MLIAKRDPNFSSFYVSDAAACVNAISPGILVAWPQAAVPQLLSGNAAVTLSEHQVSWVASINFISQFFGGVVSLVIASNYGKRKMFILGSLPILLGWCFIASAKSFSNLIIGRLFLGFGGGMVCNPTEIYMSEISPSNLRSTLTILFCSSLHTGILISFAIGPQLDLSTSAYLYSSVAVFCIFLFLQAPETPFWLVSQGKFEKAESTLKELRGKNDVNQEFRKIIEFVQKTTTVTNKNTGFLQSFRDVLSSRPNRRGIILVIFLTTAQQFSGMQAMHSYAELIFEKFNFFIRGRHVSVIIRLIELSCTIFSSYLIQRLGRRFLVISSTALCSSCMFIMGSYFHLNLTNADANSFISFLPIICIVIFALSYGLGLSPMSAVVAAECLTMDVRNIGATFQNSIVYFCAFFVTKFWQVIATSLGQQYSFWMVGLITIVHTVILILILPETKGKSLAEIQQVLEKPYEIKFQKIKILENTKEVCKLSEIKCSECHKLIC